MKNNNMPRPMSAADARTLEHLVAGLVDPCADDGQCSRRFGAGDRPSEQLVVERIGPDSFSLAHYYVQNGDMMRDPEVVFLRTSDGHWYPTYFRQDNLGVEHFALRVDAETGVARISMQRYASLRDFARIWLRNLRDQHSLD